tara:strand:+ start:187 stop:1155 length:969 start_codon:yes stop_codon:yes gene_type:complete
VAYIGRPSIVGNFVKLDSITAVNGQAAYTMQNSSVNFTDYSTVNQFLVSLNGTIQSPGSSFTVSGSTLTFASNLSTGDVIDFIIVFGNSLSAGVPTDATVTTAKIVDANVTTAKLASNSVTAAKLNNDIISGSTELASEPADTDEFLVSDAGTLKRIDYSLIKGGGITNAQQWRITANMTGMDNGDHITNNWEEADTYGYARIGDAMSNSSGIFTFPTTGIWLITHNVTFLDATEQSHLSCIITTTTDNGTYNSISISKTSLKLINSANTNAAASAQTIFDVTNTSTHKIRFAIGCQNNNIEVVGSTNANYTSATFIRLGDT